MKKYFVPVAVVVATILTASAAKKGSDPVLMTVNGKDVPVSEFVYLYEKNNQQQAEPQTLDEYVDMFVKYKLKVADAEAAGLDTTAAFRKEYVGYCDDLAKPFLSDSTVLERLRHEAYQRMLTQRNVSHIMLPPGQTPDEKMANYQRLDSIRTVILNGADFADMAKKYSSDRAAMRNGGNMGWILSYTGLPYPFVEAAYATEVGKISPVFDDAPYGFHIVRVEGERANPGEVNARHILKITRGLSAEDAAAKKAQIDSIYTLLKNGADFAELAKAESEDPGSASKGGELGWFGPNQMVKEFEDAAFSLPAGGFSEPFATAYGYHIVQTLDRRSIPSYEDVLPMIDKQIASDRRADEPRKARLAQLRNQMGSSRDEKAIARVHSAFAAAPSVDSLLVQQMRQDYTTVGSVGLRKISVADVANTMSDKRAMSPKAATEMFDTNLDRVFDDVTADEARRNLADVDPAYRNLVNEYRDGILLFEISNRNVWDRSNKDTEGLDNYFRANRDKYAWDAPRFKCIIVSATTDSIANAAQAYLKDNPVGVDSLVQKLRGEFGRNIRVERKVFPKGEDAVVDYLGFGAPNPGQQGKWTGFFLYEGKTLEAPEEVADVRAAVVNDYQQWLENEWVNALRKKYKVKINKKELNKLRN